MFNWNKKEAPLLGLQGSGGGLGYLAPKGSVEFKNEYETYGETSRFSSYTSYGTVTENDTGYTLPGGAWSHYGGKVRELDTGGFKIVTSNSATTDFFMGCWIKVESYAQSKQMGLNLFGNYVYWEFVDSDAKIGIRHNGGGRTDSSATSVEDGNWHHIALSRTGGTLYGFVDGTSVVSTTSGVNGNSVGANAEFWFFGGSGTSYNIDGQIIDPFVYIGQGRTSYTTPTSPLISATAQVNDLFGGINSSLYYASPGVAL
jgi:hypothetical protein